MAAVVPGWKSVAVAAALVTCAWPVAAQEAAYRCGTRGSVTYSQVPCPGGRVVGQYAAHASDKWKTPPQDRAVLARRAQLSPEDRQECRVLDGRVREQQHALQVQGAAATLQDEMPLVESKKRFRELGC
jgi:hypothetical protein